MMAANAAVLDPLTLGGKFNSKLLVSVDTTVGAISMDLNSNGSSVMLKTKLSLDRFRPGETYLVDDGKFTTLAALQKMVPPQNF
jgi:hypothetical protein